VASFRRTDFTYDARRNLIREAISSGGTILAVTDRSWEFRGHNIQCMKGAAVTLAPHTP
jgi:hypothetical protein